MNYLAEIMIHYQAFETVGLSLKEPQKKFIHMIESFRTENIRSILVQSIELNGRVSLMVKGTGLGTERDEDLMSRQFKTIFDAFWRAQDIEHFQRDMYFGCCTLVKPITLKEAKSRYKWTLKNRYYSIMKSLSPHEAEVVKAVQQDLKLVKLKNINSFMQGYKHLIIVEGDESRKRVSNAIEEVMLLHPLLKHRVKFVDLTIKKNFQSVRPNYINNTMIYILLTQKIDLVEEKDLNESIKNMGGLYVVSDRRPNDTRDSYSKIYEIKPIQECPKSEITLEMEDPIRSILKPLDSLVGIGKIKSEIEALLIQAYVFKKFHNSAFNDSLHFAFQGNAGTGKTTVARLLSGMFHQLGMITKPEMIETDRGDLVAGYVGQTALKTKAILESARGGILFIDEAYSLISNGRDFGSESISTIVKFMEDYRSEIGIVFAGYTEPLNEMIQMNRGLRGRITHYFNFEDYSPEELLEILLLLAADETFIIEESLKELLLDHFFKVCTWKENQEAGVTHFSNGRYARQVFETLKKAYARRIYYNPHESLLTLNQMDFFQIQNKDEYHASRHSGMLRKMVIGF